MFPPYLASIYQSRHQQQQVTNICIVGDNASTHAKPGDAKQRRKNTMRRCLTAPELAGSRQLLYQRRSLLDDDSDASCSMGLCRWDSAPSSSFPRTRGSQRRLTKDIPPVLKRRVGGSPITLKKSISLTTMGLIMGDRPPTYIRRNNPTSHESVSSGNNNNSPSVCTLSVISKVLGAALNDAHVIVDEPELPKDEIPQEALSF